MWTNKDTYNEAAGQTGPEDLTETKMPTFWRTPFTKICLGMRSKSGNVNWMTISKTADSLFSLLADGTEKTTTLGKLAWETLFPDHALQKYPCKEGFNIQVGSSKKARLGLTADDGKCGIPDSYIGVGMQFPSHPVSCGSVNTWLGPSVASNCFIFVQ
jgi:hypothetical protein